MNATTIQRKITPTFTASFSSSLFSGDSYFFVGWGVGGGVGVEGTIAGVGDGVVTFVVFVVLVKAMGRRSLLFFSSVRCEGDNCCWDDNFRIDEAWANFETPLGNATDSNKHSMQDAMKRVILVIAVDVGWDGGK